jgi:hypothetical protein
LVGIGQGVKEIHREANKQTFDFVYIEEDILSFWLFIRTLGEINSELNVLNI